MFHLCVFQNQAENQGIQTEIRPRQTKNLPQKGNARFTPRVLLKAIPDLLLYPSFCILSSL
jgi:hypothetical protein